MGVVFATLTYQLVVYAISQRDRPQSAILYPTTDARAEPARIDVTDPLFGKHLGQVWLRPVKLPMIEELVHVRSLIGRQRRIEYARCLAFG